MSRPDNFISTTDFPTLKNSSNDSMTVDIPASVSISLAPSSQAYSAELNIGTQNVVARARFKSSIINTTWKAGTQREFIRNGTVGGSPVQYSIYVFIHQQTPGIVRCQTFIPNPYGATLVTSPTPETISFRVNTFVPPFA